MLDSMNFPGVPDTEQARRRAWLKIPRVARAAIRRLHVDFGHQTKAVMLQILNGRKSAAELIEGCKAFKRPDCSEIENSSKVAKIKAPSMYSFNHEVVCDAWFIHDMDRTPFGILSFACKGTAFQVSAIVMEGTGVPNSGRCFEKCEFRWASWAGFPHIFTTDRGLHNRGNSRKSSSTMVYTCARRRSKLRSTSAEPRGSKAFSRPCSRVPVFLSDTSVAT